MIKPKPPCGQKCPNRHIGCRSECEVFQDYEAKRLEWYDYCNKKQEGGYITDSVLYRRHDKAERKWHRGHLKK